MKMYARTKRTVLTTLTLIYVTGAVVWVLSNWFMRDHGFGPQPSEWRITWLQAHSIIGLWFLALFGYIFHSHVEPSWRRRRRRKTGFILSAVIVLLFLTVPGLFYLTSEIWKTRTAQLHTYVGLLSVAPFIWHYFFD